MLVDLTKREIELIMSSLMKDDDTPFYDPE